MAALRGLDRLERQALRLVLGIISFVVWFGGLFVIGLLHLSGELFVFLAVGWIVGPLSWLIAVKGRRVKPMASPRKRRAFYTACIATCALLSIGAVVDLLVGGPGLAGVLFWVGVFFLAYARSWMPKTR